MSRFGNANSQSINTLIKEKIPINTTKSHKYTWGIFMEFCHERKYELNEHRSVEELALIVLLCCNFLIFFFQKIF